MSASLRVAGGILVPVVFYYVLTSLSHRDVNNLPHCLSIPCFFIECLTCSSNNSDCQEGWWSVVQRLHLGGFLMITISYEHDLCSASCPWLIGVAKGIWILLMDSVFPQGSNTKTMSQQQKEKKSTWPSSGIKVCRVCLEAPTGFILRSSLTPSSMEAF